MEIYQLQSFLVIAREGNLTRAARELNLSQSALSSQLKGLEEEFGVKLFSRTSRGMTLTGEGEALLVKAREAVDAAALVRVTARELSLGQTAPVTVGLNADPGFLRVGEITRRLRARKGGAAVAFTTSQTVSNAWMLRDGEIELGFQYGDVVDEDIACEVVGRVRACLAIPAVLLAERVQPVDWAEVFDLPWIWVGEECPFYLEVMEEVKTLGRAPEAGATAVDEQIVRELVAAGQGVAMMREDEARPLAQRGDAVIWERGWLDLPLSVAWHKRNSGDPRIAQVSSVITSVWRSAQVHDEMPWMR